jgi:glycerol-3-phosphate dehydrogenase
VIATTDAKAALLGADYCLHAVPVQVLHFSVSLGVLTVSFMLNLGTLHFQTWCSLITDSILVYSHSAENSVGCFSWSNIIYKTEATAWFLSHLLQFSSSFLRGIADHVDPSLPFISLSKGLELNTLRMMSQIIPQALRNPRQPFVALSGPSFALELMNKLPTGNTNDFRHIGWTIPL